MGGRLTDRCAVITGGASGIGHATAELFAAEGARVLAVDRPGVAASFSSQSIELFAADIAADDAPSRIVAAAGERFGRLDILFNNAAIDRRAPLPDMTDAMWDEMFAVSLRAGFRLARDAVPMLRKSSAGRIIATSSVSALRSFAGQAAYAATKAGVIALSRALAVELGSDGITSNVILPGPIWTGMTHGVIDPAREAFWSSRAPLGRLGVASDVAKVALFFASDDSAYVTGQALVVDGGIFSVA